MRIYINSSSEGVKQKKDIIKQIIHTVESTGHSLSLDWIKEAVGSKEGNKMESGPSSSEVFQENLATLSKSDACIFDISIISWGVVYQATIAISKEIPTLCLYREKSDIEYLSHMLTGLKSKYLYLQSYKNNQLLDKQVTNFLNDIEELRLVKFNFIATKRIKKYISWAAKKRGVSKSEFLRNYIVEDLIEKDDEYKKEIL